MSLNIKNIEIIHGFILYYFQNLIPYVTVKRILIQLVLSHFSQSLNIAKAANNEYKEINYSTK